MIYKSQKYLKKTVLFSLFHSAFFCLFLTIFRPIPGVDVAENFFWGKNLALGYYKHPPLFAFFSGIFAKIFGVSVFTNYLLCAIFIFVAFIGIFLIAKEFISENKAFLAVICLEILVFAGINARTFNANLSQIPFWILSFLFYIHAVKTKKNLHFILCGFFLGLGFLSKYFTLLLGFVLFVSFLLAKETRQLFRTEKPYLLVFSFLVTISPNIYWLFSNDFMPFNYIISEQSRNCSFFECRKHFLNFFLLSILSFIPVILTVFYIFKKGEFRGINLQNPQENALFCFSVMPFLTLSFLSGVFGTFVLIKWSATFFFILPVFIIYFWNFELRENWSSRSKIFLASAFSLWFIVIFITGFIDKNNKGNFFIEMQKLSHYHKQNWENEFGFPLKYVSGETLEVGFFYFFNSKTIDVIPFNNLKYTPYLNAKDIQDSGQIILTKCPSQNPCFTLQDHEEIKDVRSLNFKNKNYYIFIIYKKPKKLVAK